MNFIKRAILHELSYTKVSPGHHQRSVLLHMHVLALCNTTSCFYLLRVLFGSVQVHLGLVHSQFVLWHQHLGPVHACILFWCVRNCTSCTTFFPCLLHGYMARGDMLCAPSWGQPLSCFWLFWIKVDHKFCIKNC